MSLKYSPLQSIDENKEIGDNGTSHIKANNTNKQPVVNKSHANKTEQNVDMINLQTQDVNELINGTSPPWKIDWTITKNDDIYQETKKRYCEV